MESGALPAAPVPADPGARPEPAVLRVLCHEFRTPVTAVEALARALRSRPSRFDTAEQSEILELIEGHARHLAAMLDSVRVVAEELSGAFEDVASVESVRLCDLVTGAGWAAGLENRVRLQIASTVAIVSVDVPKVRRILTNLLENAVRHGGEPVTVCAVRRRTDLELLVTDCGAGVPRDVAARAFGGAAHGDGDGTRSRIGDGRAGGLGLEIVGQLVAALGGSVRPVSRTPSGPGVRVRLPLTAR